MGKIGGIFDEARDGFREILTLAFFYFAAIAAERLFADRVAAFAGTEPVLPFVAAVLAASVVGFLLRPYLVYRFADDRARRSTSAVMGTLAVAAPVVVIMARQFAAMLAGALVAACALGYAGSAAHAGLARKFGRNAHLPHLVALSYAAGVAMQLVNNVVVPGEVPSQFIFMVVAIAMVAMLHEQGDRWAATRRARMAAGIEPDADRHATAADRTLAGRLMAGTACLAGAYGLVDAALVAAGAPGALDLGAGARLLLMVGTLAAGALCGLRTRAARAAGPALAGVLAVVALVVAGCGAGAWPTTALLCLGCGFLVVFYTTAFMELAPSMHMAELWPVMGCAVAYVAGIAGALAGAPLAGTIGPVGTLVAVAVLLAGAVAALRGCTGVREREAVPTTTAGERVGVENVAPDGVQGEGASSGAAAAIVAGEAGTSSGAAAVTAADDAGEVIASSEMAVVTAGGKPGFTIGSDGSGAPSSAIGANDATIHGPVANVGGAAGPGDAARPNAAKPTSGGSIAAQPPAAAQSSPAVPVASPQSEPTPELSFTARVERFGAANGFTPRECEVLAELLVSDDSMQEIAGRLYLSRSTLYRHIAAMNQKAGTSSRAALIKAFWMWDERR